VPREKQPNRFYFVYSILYKEEKDLGRDGEEKESFDSYSYSSMSNRTMSPSPCLSQPACTVDEVLNLLRHLYSLCASHHNSHSEENLINMESSKNFFVAPDEFISKKITNKLVQQLQDPLVLASRALPAWCEDLTYRLDFSKIAFSWIFNTKTDFVYFSSAPMLFPFDTRNLYFGCTAYGTSR
jgi:E3 ubiquitin-protein ligase HECTD1